MKAVRRTLGVSVLYLMLSPLIPIYLLWAALQAMADGWKWCFEGRLLFRWWLSVCDHVASKLGVEDIT